MFFDMYLSKADKSFTIKYSERKDIDSLYLYETPFWYRDIKPCLEDDMEFVYAYELFIDKNNRNKGFGTSILKEFCNCMTNDNKVIIVQSSLLKKEYPIEPTTEQYIKVLAQLDKFFTERGFTNINQYTKSYEFSELYVYTESELGKKLLDNIKMEYEERPHLKISDDEITQAEYDLMRLNGTIDPNTLYLIKDKKKE